MLHRWIKAKKESNICKKNENLMIKINIQIQHKCLTNFVIWRTDRTNYTIFSTTLWI